jgi:hypothetical protein
VANKFVPAVNNLQGLADNLQVLSDRFLNNVAVMAVKAGVVAVEAGAVRTPVETSTARSNWTLDSVKVRTVRGPYSSGRNLGINERSAYQAVVAEAKRSGRSIAKGQITAGRSIFVSNPTPYIGKLDSGASPQNPEGNFVLIAADLASSFIASYVRSGKLLNIVDSV